MAPILRLSSSAQLKLQSGGVFVPSPLALDERKQVLEQYQRLLTLYYIKSGAKAVIPGAHISLDGYVYQQLSRAPRGKRIERRLLNEHKQERITIYS